MFVHCILKINVHDLELNDYNFHSKAVRQFELQLHTNFILRVQAGLWLPEKTNLLWISMVIILAVSLVLVPGISKFVSHCQQKKEDDSPSEVVYVRNPGESLLCKLRPISLFLS
jgi:hypothetical protein